MYKLMKSIIKINKIFAVIIMLFINFSCKYEPRMIYKEITNQVNISNHTDFISVPLLFSIDTIIILPKNRTHS